MQRLVALAGIALVLGSASGCAIPRGPRYALVGAGAGLVVGGAMMGGGIVDADHDGVNDTTFDDDLADIALAPVRGMLITGGLALLLVGLTAHDPHVAEAPPRWTPPPPAWSGAAPLLTPPRAPLPEVATTDDVLRLAKQVRAAAGRGQCEAAWATLSQILAVDRRYGDALAAGPVMAPCMAELHALTPRDRAFAMR